MSDHRPKEAQFKQVLILFCTKICSLLFLGGTLFVGLALLTYQPWDPSFSTVTDAAVQNKAGLTGALIADVLFQGIGYGAWSIVVIGAFWSHRAWSKNDYGISIKAGLFFGILAVLCFAGLGHILLNISEDARGIFTPAGEAPSWGGIAGTMLSYGLGLPIPETYSAFSNWIIGGILLPCAGLSFYLSTKFSPREFSALFMWIFSRLFSGAFSWIFSRAFAGITERMTPLVQNLWQKSRWVKTGEDEDDLPSLEQPQSSSSSPPAPLKKRTFSPAPPPLRKQMMLGAKNEEDLLPDINLISPLKTGSNTVSKAALAKQGERLSQVLGDFGIRGDLTETHPGPVVTLYKFVPAAGVKSSRVIALADDIARSMSAVSTRVSVIPGQNAMGIELPNDTREMVGLKELLTDAQYKKTTADLPLALGCDIGGQPVIADLARMPHLLVAGTTGSGKSVAINTMILSLLYHLPPEKCKFIMIDPKMLELSVYNGIPHLLSPVVTEPKKAVVALKWVVREMEERYRSMSQLIVRNIHNYNTRLKDAASKGEELSRRVQTGVDPDSGKPVFETQSLNLCPLPFIVVIVDEMADLMLVAGKEVESAIQRLAQMARAAGIHIIMATQRPSVDVITGTIKANFPTRISFQVTSKIDSRTILSEPGAEQLLGKGDMLYMAGGGRITRVHGPFVHDQEVENVVKDLSDRGVPNYISGMTEEKSEDGTGSGDSGSGNIGDRDPLYDQVVALLAREKKASTSFVQRHFQIGYNRAARIIDQLEEDGVVSPANHVGRRQVLLPEAQEAG